MVCGRRRIEKSQLHALGVMPDISFVDTDQRDVVGGNQHAEGTRSILTETKSGFLGRKGEKPQATPPSS